jgi:hypothetical protein
MSLDHGHMAEDTLEFICRQMFGDAFVYRSPILHEPSGKKVELTDILILAGKTLITIQSKSIDIEASKADEVELERIYNRYAKAKKQINRTLNAATRKENVLLETVTVVPFEVPWSMIETKIGIITINLKDQLYTDPEFRYQLPLKSETYKNIAVHGFLLRDLYVMLNEFDTLGGFIRYLNDRYFVLNYTIQEFVNDLDLLAVMKTDYDSIEEIKTGKYDMISIPPGSWEAYRAEHIEDIKRRDRKRREPTIVELMIHEFSSNLDYMLVNYPGSEERAVEGMLRIIGSLALLARTQRILIERTFQEKYLSTKEHKFRYFMFPNDEIGILFLITNETDRELRKDRLFSICCILAKSIHDKEEFSEIKTIQGIVTEGIKAPGRSFDALIADCDYLIKEVGNKEIPKLFRFRNEGPVDEWSV